MIRRQPRKEAVAVTFLLPKNHPFAPVSVVGNFNQWQPHRHPMINRPDGTLSTTQCRVQGRIAVAGADINMTSTSLVLGGIQPLPHFTLAQPTL